VALTSRPVLDKLRAQGRDLVGPEFLFVEDVRTSAGSWVIRTLIRILPMAILRLILPLRAANGATAAIVFVVRDAALPVGVRLGHSSIITNARQMASLFPPKGDDVLLAATPLHGSLGLTMTLFLPLLESVPLVCHDNPADVRTMGKLCVEFEATVLCSDPDMLRIYAASPVLHPLMFTTLRFVLSGGGLLDDACVQAFRHKFGLIIHDGYGTTETTPVATVNAPDVLNPADLSVQQGRKPGTVGLPLPGSALRIVDPLTLADLPHGQSGRILIGGTQLMQGYVCDEERTRASIIQRDGIDWFVTSDLGRLDEDGFLILETDS
jgi:acyl-[acyl-carrier-protein]-phospholipid O-acyltransferase/long-chain-fatty-acid--[acyl-carrier-protein] ligase